MKEALKEFGRIGVRVLLFLMGFCACFSMFSGALVVLTSMTLFDSLLSSIIPGILFGLWCQHLTKEDYED